MRTLLIAAAAVATLATPAFAQDATFNGPRAQVLLGWDHLSQGKAGDHTNGDGVTYGGAIGYDRQMGKIVVGIDGEVTGSDSKASTTGALAAADQLGITEGRDLYAGARIGYVVTPKIMVYAKGGYTNARFGTRYTNGTTFVADHEDADGYRVGGGVEYALTPKVFVNAEYRFSDYGKLSGFDTSVKRDQVLGGLGVRF